MAMRRNGQDQLGRGDRINEAVVRRIPWQAICIAKIGKSQRRVLLEVMLLLVPPMLDRQGIHYRHQ